MNEQNQVQMDVKQRWFKPVNRIGRYTMIAAMLASFAPFLYLYITYRELPTVDIIFAGYVGVLSSFLAGYIVEPISFYSSLGTAPNYMAFLAGSIGQMRVPAAIVAKRVAGVEDDTQEAEIVATCGVAGSVFLNLLVLVLTALAGTIIIRILPEVVLSALSAYILPAIFGAVLAMNSTKSRLKITIPVLILSFLLNMGVKKGILPLPGWSLIVICVVVGIFVARFMYKKKLVE